MNEQKPRFRYTWVILALLLILVLILVFRDNGYKGEYLDGNINEIEQLVNGEHLNSENKKETALRMLKAGKLTVEEIAEYSALSVAEVEQLANLQTI